MDILVLWGEMALVTWGAQNSLGPLVQCCLDPHGCHPHCFKIQKVDGLLSISQACKSRLLTTFPAVIKHLMKRKE